MIRGFERLLGWLTAVAAIALAIMVLLVTADALHADILHRPISGIFSFVKSLLAIIVFLGLPRVIFAEGNITVEAIDRFTGRGGIALLRASGSLLAAIYLGLLLWHMLLPARDAYVFGDARNDFGMPDYLVWLPVLLGMSASLLAAILATLRQFRRATRSEKK